MISNLGFNMNSRPSTAPSSPEIALDDFDLFQENLVTCKPCSHVIDEACSPVIQNVVSTCSLNCNLNLKEISKLTINSEYNPKKFPAIIIRLRSPKATAKVFASGRPRQRGKMNVVGAKSEYDSLIAARKFARMIQKIEPKVTFKDFKIQNIVASCQLNIKIGIDDFISNNKNSPLGDLSYDSEIFPGIIFKFKSPKMTFVIFASGKMNITGAKRKAEIDEAFEKITENYRSCSCPSASRVVPN